MRDWRGSYSSPNQGRLSQTTSESTSLGNAEVTPPCLGPSVVMGTSNLSWAMGEGRSHESRLNQGSLGQEPC